MCVLLPVTSAGTPGSVTPTRTCRSDGFAASGHSIDARYHVFGTRMNRCMSLATMALPSADNAPDTAQLLLPRASRSAGATPNSQPPTPKESVFDARTLGSWALEVGSWELGVGS